MFEWLKNGKAAEPREGMSSPRLTETEFQQFLSQFQHPNFDALTTEIQRIAEAARDAYANSRNSTYPQRRRGLRQSEPRSFARLDRRLRCDKGGCDQPR
jgi:hypothetical protein